MPCAKYAHPKYAYTFPCTSNQPFLVPRQIVHSVAQAWPPSFQTHIKPNQVRNHRQHFPAQQYTLEVLIPRSFPHIASPPPNSSHAPPVLMPDEGGGIDTTPPLPPQLQFSIHQLVLQTMASEVVVPDGGLVQLGC